MIERTAVAATIGGTAAELGGGKFANGALTASFDHLFNDEAQRALKAVGTAINNTTGATAAGNAVDAFKAGDILNGVAYSAVSAIQGAFTLVGLNGIVGNLLTAAENAGSNLVNVIHFTDQAGADAIQASGALRAGSYVTRPSEVEGMTQAAVEEFLEIQPGRGATSTTIQVPRSQLVTPPNGPFTSGGATQFQITAPTPPGTFVPTPP